MCDSIVSKFGNMQKSIIEYKNVIKHLLTNIACMYPYMVIKPTQSVTLVYGESVLSPKCHLKSLVFFEYV